VVTVEADVDQVERRLAAGELSCPSCGGVLAGWGRGRPRQLRGADGPVELCPRRSRCTECGVTHVLLPVTALLRRAVAGWRLDRVARQRASMRLCDWALPAWPKRYAWATTFLNQNRGPLP